MKISKIDFETLTTIVEFHFKFSEYIRETNEELFFRAVDYGKTYAKPSGAMLTYWHEDNKKFLKELNSLIHKREALFTKFMYTSEDKEEAMNLWLQKRKTSKDDPIGIKKYLSNFIQHAKELNCQAFDSDDWTNYADIARRIKNNSKFTDFIILQITKHNGTDTNLIDGLKNDDKN